MENIQFGVCCDPEQTALYADAGFDFFETAVVSVLWGSDDYLKRIRDAALPCKCCNGFLPWDLKITGPEVDRVRVAEYVEKAVSRAAECGIGKIVFGSGGARRCPEGFPVEKAAEQLLEFVQNAAAVFGRYGVTMVVEPLNLNECNVINSVAAGAVLVNRVGLPAVRLLADSYHFYKTDNEPDALVWSVPLLKHIHVATNPSRLAPGAEDWDLTGFFSILKHGGYQDLISVETGNWGDDPAAAAANAVKILRQTWNGIE
ncbi:MAG: sugar phosphate isomerase/epimerase [Lentisphaeria bacterium]|nr:sugar phosphate isomerase/epimerase [Lentisphaeria bacterium]